MFNVNLNRRQFLQGAAATLAWSQLGARGIDLINPMRPAKVGLIGTGWYGKNDLFRLLQVAPCEVVALCDVDQHMLEDAARLVSQRQSSHKKPVLYGDFRKMLAAHQFDIVLIGTPDHWHALPAIEAMKAGAHVYLQKPVSIDVMEGEAILAAARHFRRVVQVGTQRRSTPHLIEAKKNIVEAGLLGKIAYADIYCYYPMRQRGVLPVVPVPSYFDYDMWTGPAPLRPFNGLPHRRWRAYYEYSNGIVGDMCVHMLDAVRWMLGLGWPKKIASSGGIYVDKQSEANISDTQTAVFSFDDFDCTWNHRTWGTPADPEYPWGLTIYGEKGTLRASVYRYDFTPVDGGKTIHGDVTYEREKFPEDLTEKDIELHTAPATRGHMLNFLKAIDDGGRPVADIQEGHISTASCILANLSMKLGRPLQYDPARREIVGDVVATSMLQRGYRGPWERPQIVQT